MSSKTVSSLILFGIMAIIGVICFVKTWHVNDVQNIQVIQSINGDITVRREGGWYVMICPRIWEYPKASVEICKEADKDAILMQFSNKSTATLNCQIGYRIDSTNDEQIIRLHQQVEGSDEKIWAKVRTTLQTVAQCVASQYTPSESVEKFPEFAKKIADTIIHEKNLLSEGIDVVSFTCAGLPKYDKETVEQFARQKEADLAKRLASAEKEKLEAEILKTEANYKRELAEFRGKAEAETAKMTTEAERTKTLAEIAAQQKVEVEKLEKEQMLVKASKELEVAEITKQTEQKQLEIIKIKADQKIADAQAKQKEIELSGAITEQERVKLEFDMKTKIGVAAEMAKTYAHWNPQVIQVSGGNGNVSSTTSSLDNFLNMEAAKAAIEMTKKSK